MMFMPLIQKRRSIRKFLEKKVEPEKIDLLIEAALSSPSSRGLQPLEFVFVAEDHLIEKLSQAKQHGSAFLKNAPLGIVVCGDSEKSDVWIEDYSIGCTFIQLAAESIGLASCWIQIRTRMHNDTKTAEEYIREALHIPPHLKVGALIAVGYAGEKKSPRSQEELLYKKIHLDTYGAEYPKPYLP